MANSKIVITFGEDAFVGDTIYFERQDYHGIAGSIDILETFVASEYPNNYEVYTPPAINVEGVESAKNFIKSFNRDYNGYSNFIVTNTYNAVSGYFNDVTIEYYNDAYIFQNFSSNNANFTAVITNTVQQTFQLVGDAIFSEAIKECSTVNVSLETTELATKVWVNDYYSGFPNTTNPAVFPIIRGITNAIKLENATGDIIEYPDIDNVYYDYLTSENITVSVIQYLTGATISVSVADVVGLELEYSLDNVNWQTSNVFTGQEEGTKFLYVRDQFGCLKSKEYVVNALGTRDPFNRISIANSINFSKEEVVDGCTIFANDENSLACDSLQQFKYITDTLFQTCDKTTIQLKSNYDTITAVLIDENELETSLTVLKKSVNLSRFQSLDALYYKYREGKLAVYFENGNEYDEFGTIINTFTLGGNLPEFAIIGNEISIDTLGIYEIVDILYDEDTNKRVIIVNYSYSSETPTDTIVESIYDILPYEIYEFEIDWSLFDIGKYTVRITNTDDVNDTVIYNSERIRLETEYSRTLAISYSNNNNNDIFYKYGIEHFIRIPYVKFISVQQDDNEVNITDDNSVVVESSVYQKNEILFNELTDKLKNKLVVALSCENLFINGIGYVKDGNVSSENIDNTNLYEVTATLIKTNISYTNYKQGLTGVDNDGTTDASRPSNDIPLIITDGTNFIKS